MLKKKKIYAIKAETNLESHFHELLRSISKGHSGSQYILLDGSLKLKHAKSQSYNPKFIQQ